MKLPAADLCGLHVYMFHIPSVTLGKGQAVQENTLLFFKYFVWDIFGLNIDF